MSDAENVLDELETAINDLASRAVNANSSDKALRYASAANQLLAPRRPRPPRRRPARRPRL